MATSFSGNLRLTFTGAYNKDTDLSTLGQLISYQQNYGITNGTGAGNANMVFMDTRTITASSSEDIDLYGGLTDAYGTTINFTKIVGLIIAASSSNTNNVLVGGASATQFSNWTSNVNDVVVVRPGTTFMLMSNDATGYAVTSILDLLKIANSSSGSSVTYDLILIGCV